MTCSGLAYGFIPNYSCAIDLKSCKSPDLEPGAKCCAREDNWGWRYLFFTLGGISLLIFIMRFFIFTFQESPKYLLSKGRDEEALKVLQVIAKTNKKPMALTIEDFRALDNETPQSPLSTVSDEARLQPRPTSVSLTLRQKVVREVKRIGILFKTRRSTQVTILVWMIYAFDYFGFSIAGTYTL